MQKQKPVSLRSTRIPVEDLTKTHLAYSLFEIFTIWILIGLCFLGAGHARSLGIYILWVPIMTCLQQMLLTLLHDAWHGLFSKNRKLNDFIAQYFISFPCIKLWGRLKKEHLAHHSYLGLKESDPTFYLYAFMAKEPRNKPLGFAFNRLGGRVIETVAMAILGRLRPASSNREDISVSQDVPPKKVYWDSKTNLYKELLFILFAQCLIFWAISRVAPWWTYIWLWFVPLFTTTALFNLIRTFCEHAHPVSDDVDPDQRLISFKSNWLELAFIAPLHFNYHAEHHLYMRVPHYRLPELRKRLETGWGRLSFPVRSSYFRVLQEHFLPPRGRGEI